MEKEKLTRRELVEHIKQTMPSDYNEYEKLAFIEVEVAKQMSFNEQYLWGDSKTQEKIYKLAKEQSQRPKRNVERKLICVTMAELFGYVAKQFGFDVRYQKRAPGFCVDTGRNEIFANISETTKEHVCTLVGFSNGKFIEVDIQDDLARLQTNSKPKVFGAHRHGTKYENGVALELLDKQLVEDTFRKVYQLEANERFTDEYIIVFAAMLRCQGKSPIEMVEFFMNDPKIQKQLQNTKCIEANKLYKAILKVCYDFSIEGKQFLKDENQAIIEECVLSTDENQKRYSFCLYAEDSEQQAFWAYSKKSRKMVKLSQEEIAALKQKAMKIELRGRNSELKDKMKMYINSSGETVNDKKTTISLDDIFYEGEELE